MNCLAGRVNANLNGNRKFNLGGRLITKFSTLRQASHLVVFTFQFIVVGLIMRLDPDPHHDGILYGAAVRISDAGVPNRDVFAQYGPLVPEIQGIWLRFFGPSLINLRIQALLIFILVSVAIWNVAKLYTSRRTALLISSTWILAIPSVLPWPNIYTTLISISSFLLLVDLKQRKIYNSTIRVVIAASLIGIGVYGRIHLIAIFILVSCYFLLVKNLRIKLIPWACGFFGTVFSIALILQLNGALKSFISQCISWSFFEYASPSISKSFVVGLFWYPVICVFLALIILSIRSLIQLRNGISVSIFLMIALFLTLLLISKINRTGNLTLRNPKVLSIDLARNMLNSLDYSVAFIMVLAFILGSFKIKKVPTVNALGVLYSVGVMTQLYPKYDVNHLWLVSPMFIIGFLVAFGNTSLFRKISVRPLQIALLGLCVALSAQIFSLAIQPRSSFESLSLKGMSGPTEFARSLDLTMLQLEKFAKPESTVFQCENGIFAGAGGKYLASSNSLVNWGPDANKSEFGSQVFFCGVSDKVIRDIESIGYQIVFKVPLVYFGDTEPSGLWNVMLKLIK